jgi:hypothetical protein
MEFLLMDLIAERQRTSGNSDQPRFPGGAADREHQRRNRRADSNLVGVVNSDTDNAVEPGENGIGLR